MPHNSCKYRTILDLYFSLKYKDSIILLVKTSTVKQEPAESMVTLGNYLQRIIHTVATHYEPKKPFEFAKLNIKDVFGEW